MATVYIPIRVVSLQMASNPGNVYWKKITMAGTGYEYQLPAMKMDVDSHIYGKVLIPYNVKTLADGGINPVIALYWLTTATSGNWRVQISFNASTVGANINDLSFNAITLQTPGVSGFVRDIRITEFTLTMGPPNGVSPDAAASELFLDLYRNGASAGDTVQQDIELLDWYYSCSI